MMLGFKFSEVIIMTFKKKGRPYKDKNINEISNSLGEKLRLSQEITEQEYNDFYKKMKEHLQNLKK